MRLDLSQQMRLEQRMKMAPRMIQSMEILQLPIMALVERIEQETLENPVLETAEGPDAADVAEGPAQDVAEDSPAEEEAPPEVDDQDDFGELESMSGEWEDFFSGEHRPSRGAVEDMSRRRQNAEQNIAAKPPSLQEHLLEQLPYVESEPAVLDMAGRIIASLNENGYLPVDLADFVEPEDGPDGPATAEAGLKVVQGLDPAGVGARDLAECLVLQIDPSHPLRSEMEAICRDHLADVQQNRLPTIQKRTGLDLETVQEAIEAILRLNPRPGAVFINETVPAVVPDIMLDETDDGKYELRADDRQTPPLRISRLYQQLAREKDLDPKTREFLQRKLQSARWLIESIQQRRNTLQRVAQAIIDHQRPFLEKGPTHIRPLKMQEIADRVGVHVTTVSRAVDGKYMQTPRGIFSLRRFFGGGTETSDGQVVAWDRIKQKLTELIEKEDKSAPYSDEQLVKEFGKEGLKIARRTITKYRKLMDIPPARRRRQY